MNDSSSSRRWIVYAIPAAIAASAIAWAIALPREVCVSGSDNQVCSDNTYVKWTIALVGVALALIVVGIILFIRRVRHGRALARGV
jgi:ABC-type sulfate transport system permease component